ncbi:hypothetical protein LZC95_28575 [Pendulispora brunnea]|uniref:Uncharacterized protein n=1 Tax=Pendulispora brunnea TaxID=2905690 RepID=A0ABZ2JVA2_9BACT
MNHLIKGRLVVPAGLIVVGIMVACRGSDSQKAQEGPLNGLEDSGRADVRQPDAAAPDAEQLDCAPPDAGPDARTDAAQDAPTEPPDSGPVVFRPSNLPAGICDTATSKELVVAANETAGIDPDRDCDLVIPQGPDLQEICVRIYSTVKIAGRYLANGGRRAAAIVATKSFTLESSGKIDMVHPGPNILIWSPGADLRGSGSKGSGVSGGGGGGQVTSPGARGGSSGGAGGPQYGDPTSRQLIGGGFGGYGGESARPQQDPVPPGGPGAAMQFVSCGEMTVAGTMDASGSGGAVGNYAPEYGGGGAGGGAGGMILIEATKVTASGGKILARGGQGGAGGAVLYGVDILLYGGAGGQGGTGASPPTEGENAKVTHDPMPPGKYSGAGGGGGAVGRILINVPRGTSPVLTGVEIDPPAVIGTTN